MRVVRVLEDRYIIEGKEYPRVSTILSLIPRPQLEQWKQRVGEEEAERIGRETAEYGELVHAVTAAHDAGEMKVVEHMLDKHPVLVPEWAAWFDWVDRYVKKWVEVEIIVWSDRLRVAGRVDRVGVMKGDSEPSIVDIKTGRLYPEAGLQMMLYREMYNEKAKRKARRRIAVSLPRREPGELKVKEYNNEGDRKKVIELCREWNRMMK